MKVLKGNLFFLIFPTFNFFGFCLHATWPLSIVMNRMPIRLRSFYFSFLPCGIGVMVQDWSKVSAYLGYYGAKVSSIILNKLKLMKKIPTLSSDVETALVLVLVSMFLTFGARKQAVRR